MPDLTPIKRLQFEGFEPSLSKLESGDSNFMFPEIFGWGEVIMPIERITKIID